MSRPPTDAVVVGAGLAGALMAIYLARRGYRVRVVERRADPRGAAPVDSGRSINLGLSQRGIRALREVGLMDQLWPRTVPMRGRVVHGGDGALTFQPYGVTDDQILHSILRNDLNTALIDAAEALPDVRFDFGHAVIAVQRGRRGEPAAVTVAATGGGEHRRHRAPLVVGADGAFSAVRAHLHRGERAELHQEFLDWGYRELTIPANPDGSPRTELRALHVWPGNAGLMVAHPNCDGSLTATVFLPFDGAASFASLRTAGQIDAFFGRQFPDTLALIPDLAAQFAAHPVGNIVCVRTAPWQRGGVVLLGDAAHAVYPFYGQGMNAAFEDCSVLAACLDRHPESLDDALADYEGRRRPHTDVLAELSKQNFVELRDRLRSPLFLARRRADLVLNRLFPRSWVPLYTMIAHTTMPYGEALARARRQDRILTALFTAAAGAALAGVATRPMLRVRGR